MSPNSIARSPRVQFEIGIPTLEVQIDGRLGSIDGLVITVVYNCARHPTKHGFDHVKAPQRVTEPSRLLDRF